MCKLWEVIYEYGPYQSDQIFIASDEYEKTKQLAKEYLISQHLWDRVGFNNITIFQYNNHIPVYKEILMTDYFVSNTVTFFRNGDADMNDLLLMVEKYDNGTENEQQLVLIALNSLLYTTEFTNLLLIQDQVDAYNNMVKIINQWEDTWMSFVKQYPQNIDLCKNPVILNYLKIVT